jgi:hypothetical protein
VTAAAAVGDIDGDPQKVLEVVVPTRDGWLWAWHTKGTANGNIQWASFHHDNANTGNAATKLDQGTTQLAPKPIDCTPPTAPPQDHSDAGGCGCRTVAPSRAPRAGLGLALGLGLGLMAMRRRVRRT